MSTFAIPNEKRGIKSSLKRLKLYKKQVPRKTIYREALILFLRIESVRDKLRIILDIQ